MKKISVILIAIAIVLIGCGGVVLFKNSSNIDEKTTKNEAQITKTDENAKKQEAIKVLTNSFVETTEQDYTFVKKISENIYEFKTNSNDSKVYDVNIKKETYSLKIEEPVKGA